MALNGKIKSYLPKIKNGIHVLYYERENGEVKHVVSCRMDHVQPIGDDYKFELIDNKTNLPLTQDGKRRSWYFRAAHELTIRFEKTEDIKICPKCKKNFVSDEESVCIACRIAEKQNFFRSRVKMDGISFELDDEQAYAVLAECHSVVTARAGSGKTRVLTAKLIDLFCNQGVKQNEVLAFCFNTDAAAEIRKRLNSECAVDDIPVFRDYDVVKTFHSFAVNVLGNGSKGILVDDKTPARSRLIKQIITNLRNTRPRFEKELRKYFLSNTLKVDHEQFETPSDYYRYIRNSRYRTLGGEQVRSVAEKIIADFLFEHDINYRYETHFFLNNVISENSRLSESELEQFKNRLGGKKETVPDFYLPDHKIVWEHWGITGKETSKERISFTKKVGNYDEYRETMDWKIAFWNDWRHKLSVSKRYKYDFTSVKRLIETDSTVFDPRDRFKSEVKLKNLLESNGVKCEKLSEDIIIERVWKNAQDYFATQIKQFIDKFQQIYINEDNAFVEKAKHVEDDRERAFLRLGYMVYQEYIDVLEGKSKNYPEYKNYHLDFNQCLNNAAEKIRSGDCDDNIKQLKWILIDEYQDFSELFFGLIRAILSRNPDVILFCVGDDWQAINRFAGSDLKFFGSFNDYFPDSKSYNIGTNYRSEKHIVTNAGDFMERFGISEEPQRGILEGTGVCVEECIDDKRDNTVLYDWLFENGGPWADGSNVYQGDVKAYIKFCTEVINRNPGKKIMILNRKNRFLGKDLDEFARILENPKLCKIPSPDIDVKTVHRAKGEEADIVILTEVDENCFPIYHPDANLYRIFGANERTIMEDETRLFYVALTRAKQSVYVLYSNESPSCFIKKPIGKDMNYYSSGSIISF